MVNTSIKRSGPLAALAIAFGLMLATTSAMAQTEPGTGIAPSPSPETSQTANLPPPPPEPQAYVVNANEVYDQVDLGSAATPVESGSGLIVYIGLGLGLLALVLSLLCLFILMRQTNGLADQEDLWHQNENQLRQQLDRLSDDLAHQDRRVSALENRLQSLAATSRLADSGPRIVRPHAYSSVAEETPPRPSFETLTKQILENYNRILTARGPEAMSEFINQYQPRTLSVSRDQIIEAPEDPENVWLVSPPEWRGVGLALPGRNAIQNWATTFQASEGRAARNLFGHVYEVSAGNLLEIEAAAVLEPAGSPGLYRLNQKGHLRGA